MFRRERNTHSKPARVLCSIVAALSLAVGGATGCGKSGQDVQVREKASDPQQQAQDEQMLEMFRQQQRPQSAQGGSSEAPAGPPTPQLPDAPPSR